jgi:hypothetical protein|tara:strand:+ start:382 stop:606 length:225 start_codon:yes stop_codon:yes gene_type:complete
MRKSGAPSSGDLVKIKKNVVGNRRDLRRAGGAEHFYSDRSDVYIVVEERGIEILLHGEAQLWIRRALVEILNSA